MPARLRTAHYRVLPRFGKDRSQSVLTAAQDANVAKSWITASATLQLSLTLAVSTSRKYPNDVMLNVMYYDVMLNVMYK